MQIIELHGHINDMGQLEIDLPKRLRSVDVKVTLEVSDVEEVAGTPKHSLLGLLADLGPAPSAEDIDEARSEMWANFPRDDIA